MKLSKNTSINKYAINLKDGKQPSYGPIYALSLVKLKTLKIYIGIHLKTRFIQHFKFLADAPIVFDTKFNSNLQLYIDY